jgi:hypothetical protein
MATRIQVRRGSTSDWNTADPILNEGEIGYNTTLGQIKIGDGESNWSELFYVVDTSSLGGSLSSYILSTEKSAIGGVAELDASKNILAPAGIIFEGTADAHETTLSVVDPTADRTITLPNTSGTVITTGNLSDITNIGVFSSTITMEGSTANDFELTLSAGDPTADRTITFPDETGTVQLRVTDVSDTEIGYLNGVTSSIQTQLDDKSTASKTETFTNKSISLGSNTVTSTLAQLNTAVSDADVASLAGTETLTNKTLTSPKINEDVAVTATATELNYVDGVTSAIQTQLDGKVDESLFDAKGDLLVASADNTPTKLTVGTNGYILTANTSAANGIEWAAAPAGYSPPTLGSTQIASGATVTTIAGLTLSTPTVSGLAVSDASIVFEGATANEFETTLTVTDPTADRTITLPDATTTLVGRDTTDTLSNKTLTTPTINGGEITATGGTPRIHGIYLPEAHFITFEGATNNEFETVLTVADSTADRTITLPDATGTVALAENVAALSGATFTGAVSGTSLTLSGDLTVNGTTTTINSTTLTVDDINITIGQGNTSDALADGGGITLEGATNKTFNWVDATDAWTSSEHMNLLTGKSYKINNTAISAALPALTWGEVKNGKSGLTIS